MHRPSTARFYLGRFPNMTGNLSGDINIGLGSAKDSALQFVKTPLFLRAGESAQKASVLGANPRRNNESVHRKSKFLHMAEEETTDVINQHDTAQPNLLRNVVRTGSQVGHGLGHDRSHRNPQFS